MFSVVKNYVLIGFGIFRFICLMRFGLSRLICLIHFGFLRFSCKFSCFEICVIQPTWDLEDLSIL